MPLYTTDALILRTYKLGESDRIVVFLTRDRGKKRGVAKNARQSRRRFGGGLEPLTYGRVGYVERERRELVRLDYVEQLRSPLSAIDGEALGYVSYFAELIDEWAQEADPNETLFRLGVSMVDARLSEDARAFLAAVRRVTPIGLAHVKVAAETLRELEATHRALIATHLEKDLKSVRVLREMRR
jgi:DNA repair protein RecO